MQSHALELVADGSHALFDTGGMLYREFPSDFRQIRYNTLLIDKKAPPEIQEINLLEQQLSELIKNAVKHGNRCDPAKRVRVWYRFEIDSARAIVEDEGSGFTDLEAWNEFNRRRLECLRSRDFGALAEYVSFRTGESDEEDGGNAMFAALEYWNRGVVFNDRRNGVAVMKAFPSRRIGRRVG